MNNTLKTTRVRDCKVCYVPHSDEIHDATLRVRNWLRNEVTRKLGWEPETDRKNEEPVEVA